MVRYQGALLRLTIAGFMTILIERVRERGVDWILQARGREKSICFFAFLLSAWSMG